MEENGNNRRLCDLLIELRTKKKMTQKELAEKLMVSDKTISRWETGNSLPDMDMLYSISKFFKVSINDLSILRVSSKEGNEEIVEEIIKDFSRKDKQKQRIIKIGIISFVLIILFLIGMFIFSASYNRFKVYKIEIKSDTLYRRQGIYVETKIKDSLYLNTIGIRNYTPKESDIISVDIYYLEDDKENILQSYSSLDNIKFSTYDSYIKIDDLSKYFDNLYVKVTIIDSKNKVNEYIGKLIFTLDFSNNKIYSNEDDVIGKNTINLTPEEIKKILLANGFKKIDETTLNKDLKNINIRYIIPSNKIYYVFEKIDYIYRYSYEINKNLLQVNIFDDNNNEIENYTYDVGNKNVIECVTGKCNSYEEALDTLNKNLLYLFQK